MKHQKNEAVALLLTVYCTANASYSCTVYIHIGRIKKLFFIVSIRILSQTPK